MSEYIPSAGMWFAEVSSRFTLRIKPGGPMQIMRAVLPLKLRKSDEGDAGWLCRLKVSKVVNGVTDAGVMLVSLVPCRIDNGAMKVLLHPGDQYVFDVIGGGDSIFMSGEFLTESDKEYPDTELRKLAIRPKAPKARAPAPVVVKSEEDEEQ
ncbi:hypothetical protein D9611_013476 [Ephemerocybe angulata]|uniref:Uncharacterized protein n=1 Tax=Ephemerocybe angulata TaxID=980116 RepID=A0A8H5BTI6_9AGAR|nr:hypothetical protein D9611_013476 [Tulosesus angulatus]